MIVADVLAPWWSVEATDGDGNTYQDTRRLPQFLHDVGSMEWRDGSNQLAERIPPSPGLCAWRVWCSEAQLAALVADARYRVIRSAEVTRAHEDPAGWPVMATGAAGASDAAFPPLPTSGWLEAGAIYQVGTQAVIVRQSHNRTEHAPADVPALFMVYRADSQDLLAWVAGEAVQVGMERTYGGATYRCIQAHVTESAWTPDATPSLWAVVVEEPTTIAWAVGVAYQVGDEVTYQGATYRCLQAHTSIVTWTPTAAVSLWQAVSA